MDIKWKDLDEHSPNLANDINYALDPRAFINEMQEAGFTIIMPKYHRLLLDLDSEKNRVESEQRLDRMIAKGEIKVRWIESWKSGGGNTHRIICMADKLDEIPRLLLQMYLCSDPVREYLSFRRVQKRIRPHNILARPWGAVVSIRNYMEDGSIVVREDVAGLPDELPDY